MSNANGAQGGSDFSAQWIQYYRSMGMHREAEFIEQQAKQLKVCAKMFYLLKVLIVIAMHKLGSLKISYIKYEMNKINLLTNV